MREKGREGGREGERDNDSSEVQHTLAAAEIPEPQRDGLSSLTHSLTHSPTHPPTHLQSVEVGLQLGLLVCLGWLGDRPVLPELLQTLLSVLERVLWCAVAEPRQSALYPLQQLCSVCVYIVCVGVVYV